MSPDHMLTRLAAAYGIQPGYHDIRGEYHVAPPLVLRALLTAMGVPCDTPVQVALALEEQELHEWRRPLAPVQVVRESAQPVRVVLVLPVAERHSARDWRLDEESGTEHRGTLILPEDGEQRRLDDVDYQRWHWTLPLELPCGYHRLRIAGAEMTLIVAPERCQDLPEGRHWGLAVQLYTLRSGRNWGMGDFGDLRAVVDRAAELGAATIGLNPLHALYPDQPERASPYGPSSRRWFNPLYLDIEALPEFATCPEARARVEDPAFQQQLAALRATEHVDYAGVAAAKNAILRLLYSAFRQRPQNDARVRSYQAFRAEHGEVLQRQALFEALQGWFRSLDPAVHGWSDWLPGYRHPESALVQAFAAEHADTIDFHAWLHWLAVEQLETVVRHARDQGLKLGLYQDLAVGVDCHGGETWTEPGLYAMGARVGAPPDDFSPGGQDWGLPPAIPERLRETAYASFIATLRTAMRRAGVLRIDHVMALSRLFWVPPSGLPMDGAYVSYPLDDLLGILALESRRQGCAVVGEDLGTVTDELRAALNRAGVLSYRLLYFEKHWGEDGRFKAPYDYPEQALVAASTHDLPTLAGFWIGRDIDWREQLELFPDPETADQQRAERETDRHRLLAALDVQGLLPAGSSADVPFSPALMLAIQQYLARTPARLMMVQIEDLLGQVEQVNLPGTVDQHPNWRRRLAVGLEDWPTHPEMQALKTLLAERQGD
jgi:4-alpha-glucanotransferase